MALDAEEDVVSEVVVALTASMVVTSVFETIETVDAGDDDNFEVFELDGSCEELVVDSRKGVMVDIAAPAFL